MYASKVLEVEHGTFTLLVFTTTGMADECKRFHSCLSEFITLKQGEEYSTTISWIRTKVSFAILRSALLCLRGARALRRVRTMDLVNRDFDIDRQHAGFN